MKYTLFSLLVALVLITGCQQSTSGGPDDLLTTEGGTRYYISDGKPDAQLVQPGDYLYFQAALTTERDSVLFDTRDGGGPPPAVEAAGMDKTAEQIGPVEDVLRVMRLGETAVVRVNIADFPNKPPGMENDTVMQYVIELNEIVDKATYDERQAALRAEAEEKAAAIKARAPEVGDFSEQVVEQYKAGELDGELVELQDGLKYIIHEKGDGPQAQNGKGVVMQYVGRLVSNNTVFDQSFEQGRGLPFVLGSGRVIPGWELSIVEFTEGTRATVFIPSELAYGAQGSGASIPPNSELAFYVEVEDVQE